MSDPECSLGLVHCEAVSSWPTGGTLVAILAVIVGGIWLYRRSR